ncbi:hypothetical protein LINPERHAP1_LOCUS8281 [Linum perenne]
MLPNGIVLGEGTVISFFPSDDAAGPPAAVTNSGRYKHRPLNQLNSSRYNPFVLRLYGKIESLIRFPPLTLQERKPNSLPLLLEGLEIIEALSATSTAAVLPPSDDSIT